RQFRGRSTNGHIRRLSLPLISLRKDRADAVHAGAAALIQPWGADAATSLLRRACRVVATAADGTASIGRVTPLAPPTARVAAGRSPLAIRARRAVKICSTVDAAEHTAGQAARGIAEAGAGTAEQASARTESAWAALDAAAAVHGAAGAARAAGA